MSVIARQFIEKHIARRLVEDLLAAGFTVARADCCGSRHMELEDCDECSASPCIPADPGSADAILAAMFQGDDDRLWIAKDGELTGSWIWLIYGNGGDDVISDYTVDLDPVVLPICDWIEAGLPPRAPTPLAALVAAVEANDGIRAGEVLGACTREQLDDLLTAARGQLAGLIVAAMDAHDQLKLMEGGRS